MKPINLLVPLIFSFLTLLVSNDLQFGLIIFLISFLGLILLEKIKPAIERKIIEKKIESELGLFLMQLSNEIKFGNSLEKSFKKLSRSDSKLSKEINKILNENENGKSLREGLLQASNKFDSLEIKRFFSQLVSIYDSGGKEITSMKILAKELLNNQKIAIKIFSSKMAMLSLIFIAVSSVIPALFQTFIGVSGMAFGSTIDETTFTIITLIIFPIINIGIMIAILAINPEV